jgi:predicted Zn-dependent protease
MLESVVKSSPHYNAKDPADLQLRHDMMRAKIAAYTQGLGLVRRLFKDNPKSAAARYGVAISQFLQGKTDTSLRIINQLIKEQPNNAYLYEIQAEVLLRARKPEQGIMPMQTAIRLDPYKSGLLRIQYGHLLIETGDKANAREAVKQIKKGLARDPQTISGYDYLARAHSLLGQESLALAATAEGRFLVGRHKEAKQFAIRAQQNLKKNSPQWVRLQDIILYKPKKKRR